MTKTSEVVQPVLMAENEKDILIFKAGTLLWLEIGRQKWKAETRFSAKKVKTSRKIAGLAVYELTSELIVTNNNRQIKLPIGTRFAAYASQIIRSSPARR